MTHPSQHSCNDLVQGTGGFCYLGGGRADAQGGNVTSGHSLHRKIETHQESFNERICVATTSNNSVYTFVVG
jgi:hypothetical protein